MKLRSLASAMASAVLMTCSLTASLAADAAQHVNHLHKQKSSSIQQQQQNQKQSQKKKKRQLQQQYKNYQTFYPWQQQPQQYNLRQTTWPHTLTLKLTFDANPSDISWKFENTRTKRVLAGVPFDKYPANLYANKTIEVPLDILTSEDFEGEDEEYFDTAEGSMRNPYLREYRFVIYDRGGNGLCCEHGNGKYELYSKNTLVAYGSTFGAIEDTEFTIDPRIFLGSDWNGGIVNNVPVVAVNIPGTGTVPIVNIPTISKPTVSIPTAIIPAPAQPSPTATGINSPPTPKDNAAPSLNAPSGPTVVGIPNTPSIAVAKPVEPTGPLLPTFMASFYCGTSFDDAEENCHHPCPSGSPAECADNPNLNFLVEEYVCFSSTTCRDRTVVPSPPTPRPIAMNRPNASPASPSNTNDYIDANTWFCGEDWNWVKDNCDKAKPCPGGDAVDCPANHICIASTPCTLVPTSTPSEVPSSMPTESPTPNPTKSPWSDEAFIEFLNGPPDEPTGGQPAPRPTEEDSNLASQVNQALENYNELQYHFFCGISWAHADEKCDEFCPSGDTKECPDGQECYANTRCDGRDTPPPTISPAPTPKLVVKPTTSTVGTGGDVCSLCDDKEVNPTKTVPFQGGSTSCGELNQMIMTQNILVGSNSCNTMRDMYKNSCCYDKCHLCERSNGNILDLKDDHIVKQGGYEASCQEINSILAKSDDRDNVCRDAQSQLGEECCYDQCSLCGGTSAEMSTEWYATVTYQGLTTTCLGLDYLLRSEQVMEGSGRCSELQGQYMSRCCYRADSCQLCRADGKLYDVDQNKIITVERSNMRSTSMSCTDFSDSLAAVGKDSEECSKGRQSYFGQCCDLGSLIASGGAISPSSPGGAPVSPPAKGEVTNPSPAEPTGSGEVQNNATAPSPASDPLDWGEEPSDFSWEKDWKTLGSSGYKSVVVSSRVVLGLAALMLFV